jgi:hypothetical protein
MSEPTWLTVLERLGVVIVEELGVAFMACAMGFVVEMMLSQRKLNR